MQNQIARRSSKEQIESAKSFAAAMNSGSVVAEKFRPMVEATAALARRGIRILDEERRGRSRMFYGHKIDQIKEQIAKEYPTWKRVVDVSYDGAIVFAEGAMLLGRSVIKQMEEQIEAAALLGAYHYLSENGMFAKLWRCSSRLPSGDRCRTLFFVHRNTKAMMCSRCSRRNYNRRPEVKRGNANYQRKYYHDWLSVDAVNKHGRKKPRRSK
jgi:hypothetical protein